MSKKFRENPATTPINNDQEKIRKEASGWFEELQDKISREFEKLEEELADGPKIDEPAGRFKKTPWRRDGKRQDTDKHLEGGGQMAIMRGRVFEKVGVNISAVHGRFSKKLASEIPGAKENDGNFWAGGISLVAHMCNPHVPAVHMNTRHICTSKSWFGGGADLTPIVPENHKQDTKAFHDAFKKCCDKYDPEYYPRFKKWCDEYFYLPHRDEHRGTGGIFYDYLEDNPSMNFEFTKDVGKTFLEIYPRIVRAHMNKGWSLPEREYQLVRRGRYVEFNLLYDRGTRFGLETGGNTDAILMSMPPEVRWP